MQSQPTSHCTVQSIEQTTIWSEATIDDTLRTLGTALHRRDTCTHAHSQRLIYYALALGRLLGLSQAELLTLKRGVFLHDIGKLHIPDDILRKPSPLSEVEWTVMKKHPLLGYGMLKSSPLLEDVAPIVLSHHEWYDGTGYPHGLSGEEIPIGARICAVVDMLDALTANRPYRRPVSFSTACECIWLEGGTHFDPLVVKAFLTIQSYQWQELQCSAERHLLLLFPPSVHRGYGDHPCSDSPCESFDKFEGKVLPFSRASGVILSKPP
jgi:HD-GYP domain-containing protein (c-di-GMP phosphodiesterase class II)